MGLHEPTSEKSGRIRKKRIIYALISTALALILVVGGIFMLSPATFDAIRAVFTDTFSRSSTSNDTVDFLVAAAPELFGDSAFGGHDEAELRARIEELREGRDLLADEARRRGLASAEVDGKVDASFDALKGGFADQEQFSRMLKERGISEKQLRADMATTVLINELARQLVSAQDVTDAQARAYFESNKDRYITDSSKKISHILFDAKDADTATKVHEQLVSGADFAKLAAKHSKDSGSANRAGNIGWIGTSTLSSYPQTFAAAVEMLDREDISVPIATEAGLHIIKVTDIKPADDSFESARQQVVSDLLGTLRAQAIDDLLEELTKG